MTNQEIEIKLLANSFTKNCSVFRRQELEFWPVRAEWKMSIGGGKPITYGILAMPIVIDAALSLLNPLP